MTFSGRRACWHWGWRGPQDLPRVLTVFNDFEAGTVAERAAGFAIAASPERPAETSRSRPTRRASPRPIRPAWPGQGRRDPVRVRRRLAEPLAAHDVQRGRRAESRDRPDATAAIRHLLITVRVSLSVREAGDGPMAVTARPSPRSSSSCRRAGAPRVPPWSPVGDLVPATSGRRSRSTSRTEPVVALTGDGVLEPANDKWGHPRALAITPRARPPITMYYDNFRQQPVPEPGSAVALPGRGRVADGPTSAARRAA